MDNYVVGKVVTYQVRYNTYQVGVNLLNRIEFCAAIVQLYEPVNMLKDLG